MSRDIFAAALKKAEEELHSLLSTRANIDGKISRLKATVEALKAQIEAESQISEADAVLDSLGLSFEVTTGISNAIRLILQASKMPLTAPEIREALQGRGYDIDQYASILTVIHNTIKRLEKQGEVSPVQNEGDFVGWVWNPKPTGPTTTLGELLHSYRRPAAGELVMRGHRGGMLKRAAERSAAEKRDKKD